jgi:hypothetical protein
MSVKKWVILMPHMRQNRSEAEMASEDLTLT